MSYYVFSPRQVFSGFGATSGITFNGAQVWADWKACDAAYRAAQAAGKAFTGHPSCQRSVDAIRAALGQLGYGRLGMGVSWGSADQAAWKQWAAQAGVAPSAGMPTEAGLQVMEEQVRRGAKPGSQTAVEYEMVGDQYVEKGALNEGVRTAGIDWSKWGLLGLAGAGVVAVALVASKKKGKGAPRTTSGPRPGLGGTPAAASKRT